jgi:hypothetical protein
MFAKTKALGLPASVSPQRFKPRDRYFLSKEHVSHHDTASVAANLQSGPWDFATDEAGISGG